MTTELFEPDVSNVTTSESTKYTHTTAKNVSPVQHRANEKFWLVKEIIEPDLPNIVDTICECIDLLNSDKIFTLPISNGGSKTINQFPNEVYIPEGPSIQGIVVRQGVFVLDTRFITSFPNFRKGKQIRFRKDRDCLDELTSQKFPILQLQLIDTTLVKMRKLLINLESIGCEGEATRSFQHVFEEVSRDMEYITELLEHVPSEVVFPQSNNRLVKNFFLRDYKLLCESNHHMLSLDLSFLEGSIAIDLRNLDKVVKKPWCDIDIQNGISKVDKIKQQLRSETNEELERVLTRNDIYVMEPSGKMINFIHSTFNTTRTTLEQARFYLTNCITFDNCVVMENGERLSVTASDSNLISLCTKLKLLGRQIRTHYDNLKA